MKTQISSEVQKLSQLGYLTLHQFYKYLQDYHRGIMVSYPTLNRYYKEGKLKGKKVGGQIRLSIADIQEYLIERDESLVLLQQTTEGAERLSHTLEQRAAERKRLRENPPPEIPVMAPHDLGPVDVDMNRPARPVVTPDPIDEAQQLPEDTPTDEDGGFTIPIDEYTPGESNDDET